MDDDQHLTMTAAQIRKVFSEAPDEARARANLRAAHLVREGLTPEYFAAEDAYGAAVRWATLTALKAAVIKEMEIYDSTDRVAPLFRVVELIDQRLTGQQLTED